MLDPIPSLPSSNQALEWNQLFESRWINTWWGRPWLDPIGQGGVVRPREERERERRLGGGARGGRRSRGGGGLVAGGSTWRFRPKREREKESKRERERYDGMIDERENEWRGVYIIPSPR